jgi:hypothetical protein
MPHSALMDAFGFNAEDLSANRADTLTEGQMERIAVYLKASRVNGRLAFTVCMASVIVFLGMTFILGPADEVLRALPYLASGLALYVLVFCFFIALGIFQSRHLSERRLSVVEGTASRSTRRLKQGRWTAYYVMIEGVRFQLHNQDQYQALQDGMTYRVFYIHHPPAHVILTLDQI